MTDKQATELERAIEIAKAHGHKVFTATHRATGATVYTVRSASDTNLFHILYIEAGRIHCDCYASQHDRICSHAAAVRLFLIAQRDALASIEQAEAAAEREAQENAEYQAACEHADAMEAAQQQTRKPLRSQVMHEQVNILVAKLHYKVRSTAGAYFMVIETPTMHVIGYPTMQIALSELRKDWRRLSPRRHEGEGMAQRDHATAPLADTSFCGSIWK